MDSRVLRDVLEKQNSFEVPNSKIFNFIVSNIKSKTNILSNLFFYCIGKYFLVDVGYTNSLEYLTPYRSTHYHLKDRSTQVNNPINLSHHYGLERHLQGRLYQGKDDVSDEDLKDMLETSGFG